MPSKYVLSVAWVTMMLLLRLRSQAVNARRERGKREDMKKSGEIEERKEKGTEE